MSTGPQERGTRKAHHQHIALPPHAPGRGRCDRGRAVQARRRSRLLARHRRRRTGARRTHRRLRAHRAPLRRLAGRPTKAGGVQQAGGAACEGTRPWRVGRVGGTARGWPGRRVRWAEARGERDSGGGLRDCGRATRREKETGLLSGVPAALPLAGWRGYRFSGASPASML